MANIKSQKKRILTNEKSRLRNKEVRTSLKTHTKAFYQSVQAEDLDAAGRAFDRAGRAFDRAASKGVIHKNSAANRKSSLARALNKVKS